jgi:hypothetical protein
MRAAERQRHQQASGEWKRAGAAELAAGERITVLDFTGRDVASGVLGGPPGPGHRHLPGGVAPADLQVVVDEPDHAHEEEQTEEHHRRRGEQPRPCSDTTNATNAETITDLIPA